MSVTNILSDPMWQGIAAIIGLAAILATIYVGRRPRKRLEYWISTNESVISVKDKLLGDLELTYRGRKVEAARLVVVQIVNRGNVAILPADFHDSLRIRLRKPAEIYAYSVDDAYPENLALPVSATGDSLELQPCLLNPHDGFALKMVVGSYSGLNVDARIAELPQVRLWNWKRPLQIAVFGYLGLLVALLAALARWILTKFGVQWPSGEFILFSVAAGILLIVLDSVAESVWQIFFPRERKLPRKR